MAASRREEVREARDTERGGEGDDEEDREDVLFESHYLKKNTFLNSD